MKRIAMLLLIVLSACAPAPTEIPATQTARVEIETVVVTQVVTQLVTQIVIVTPTFTATPLFTPTITNTPLPPTATPDLLKAPKSDGFYLINVDIAPGVWRSTGTASGSCYWSVTTATGDIIDNHFGDPGGTAYIAPNGFQVEFNGCGTWEWLQGP